MLCISVAMMIHLAYFSHNLHFRSVNEVICHGIPDQRKLQEGDIVNIGEYTHSAAWLIACVCSHQSSQIFLSTMMVRLPKSETSLFEKTQLDILGFHADLNETYPVGRVDDESLKLMRTTRESLDAAIAICKPGALFRDIGKTMYVLHLTHSYPSSCHMQK